MSKYVTDTYVYTFKQITEYCNQRSSLVYVCYLNVLKTFDRIGHWYLFGELN